MKEIIVLKVDSKEDMEDFIQFPNLLYADCPYYVPDLDIDVQSTFNSQKNAGLEFSEVQAFIAFNREGKLLGRIAGIINHRANRKWKTWNVRFGFFDFVDDIQVSSALLNAVAQWGKEKGMEYIQGPMGITDFDKEGMLIEDFDQIGSMNTLYNYPYYPQHMETLGYEKEVDWIQVRINIPKETPERYVKTAYFSKKISDLKVTKIKDWDITRRDYGHKIFQLLNQAYSPLFGFTEFTNHQINDFIKQYLGLVDKRLVSVVENEENEVVGVAVSMCSLSHALHPFRFLRPIPDACLPILILFDEVIYLMIGKFGKSEEWRVCLI